MSDQRGDQLTKSLKKLDSDLDDEQIQQEDNYTVYDSSALAVSGTSSRETQNYKAAREQLLDDIVPNEDYNAKTSCLFRTCCCFYYGFCCCICCEKSKSVTKQTFVKRFEKWLNVDGGRDKKTLKVAKTMMRMYAHQPGAIKDLEKCRVNPDFNSIFRDDLEFFIPQLCSFYLKGNLENPQSLLKLIIMASQTNFFFSHRVWFFFHSAMFQEFQQQIYEMSMNILKGLKQVCLDQNQTEKLYIANSQKVSEMIVQLFMSDFYQAAIQNIQIDFKIPEEQINYHKQKQAEKVGKVNTIISNYQDKIPNESKELQGIVIAAQDIVLKPFLYSLDKNEHMDAQAQITDLKRQKLNSFLSTPKFIKCLTEISQTLGQMKDTPKDVKLDILQKELTKINQHLPASVYIPFVQNSTRNYCVLHIPPAEARVFQTKERAPIMLAIEVFRPDEMQMNINEQKNKNTLKSFGRRRNSNQPDNPYFQVEPEELESDDDDEQPRRSKFKELLMKQQTKNKNRRQLTIDQKIQKKADQSVSKPIVIKRLKENGDRKINDDFGLNYLPGSGSSSQSNLINPSDLHVGAINIQNQTVMHDLTKLEEMTVPQQIVKEDEFGMGMTQFLDYKKENFEMGTRSRSHGNFLQDLHQVQQKSHSINGDEIIKKKVLKNQINKNLTPKSTDFKQEHQIIVESQNEEETLSRGSMTDSELESCGEVSSDSGEYRDLPTIIESVQGENKDPEDEQGQNRPFQNEFQNNQNRQIVGETKPRISKTKEINKKSFVNETSKAQRIRLQESSPFGALKSWNLIRVIVKSIDDVRQEQFAMQLISQIYQIFKIKKLPLYLKTYEILATGPNCGLIEVINDAMSIDEIHKRADNASLLDYFVVKHGRGKIKSQRFKKAQKNFCYSLAAYSLVQYILQVKDRHNQNIMIDAEGHIVHIDYGFLLSNAPGKGIKFEQAPFKLTTECVNVLGGITGKYYKLFRDLVKLGFMALQEHADKIIILVEMMMLGQKDLPCFYEGEQTVSKLKERFFPTKKMMTEAEAKRYTENLIIQSENNWRTNLYDKVQYCCQGIV